MKSYIVTLLILIGLNSYTSAQSCYWQQSVEYKMDIDFDVKKNKFDGTQILKYTNNSPDTIGQVYYHLYFNAFQPGSVMDERNKVLPDTDPRVGDRISSLKKNEIGYHKIESLELNGKATDFTVNGTILEVKLPEMIKPGESVEFKMKFNSQVPIQIRRSGRDNKEGIRYSMAQWYPKICAYDMDGWHPYPYIGREFYSPWGDFEVNISIDKDYVLGATGVLQNPNIVGKGYEVSDFKVEETKSKKLTWKYKADNVIDFVWAADPDYKVISKVAHDGTTLYFIYQPNENTTENWNKLPEILDKALMFMNERYGKYPYPQYSFIQAGDGGMEYPMATLITGERSLGSLTGVSVHEWMHSWYQFMLATNEAKYPWMDEGFTSFATNETMQYLVESEVLNGNVKSNEHINSYISYINLTNAGQDEPLSTPSDNYSTNTAYGIASYSKGNVYLNQMEYILGEETFARALPAYFYKWRYKHPTPSDFLKVMEDYSGLVLDWYNDYFVNTTYKIDYGVKSVNKAGMFGGTDIVLQRIGKMPMPLDVKITLDDGSETIYHIPLDIMRGDKSSDPEVYGDAEFIVLKDWNWVNPEYTFKIKPTKKKVTSIDLNPSEKLADVNPENNIYKKD